MAPSPNVSLTERDSRQTPAFLGYRMPAEWEPHEATWLAWPHNRTDWPGKFAAIPFVYAEMVRHLARVERVRILVKNAAEEQRARKVLGDAGALSRAVQFYRRPTNRGWTRDSGPIFVRRAHAPRLAATLWRFNAWAKYSDWRHDAQVAAFIARALRVPAWQPMADRRRVVLEGGSIDVNGRGLLLTTEECQLSRAQQRNPGLSRQQLEATFRDYLGVKKVLWLGRGIAGDDTHGHVDDVARFVGPRTVAAAVERDPADPNYRPLRDNLRRLRRMTDLQGRPLQVVELPMPAPVLYQGQRLPASYANFYIANRLVLVPVFNDPNDRLALGILARLFPRRRIVGIYSGDFIWGLGAMHCMTQQQPRA
jgi:agmatine deiminase